MAHQPEGQREHLGAKIQELEAEGKVPTTAPDGSTSREIPVDPSADPAPDEATEGQPNRDPDSNSGYPAGGHRNPPGRDAYDRPRDAEQDQAEKIPSDRTMAP
ncbi:hypothetical protein [Bordetella genomosp. 5]|uniref:Uncharacterized protein n=1 Tax=Bordetella genomosp. 5 TaxID=1395608 RepID=A0A261TIL0_9BORD|nr:hypothetical protein [Bordetella genomosp. 5]OZI49067.1 hypothetical protein CAL25_15720 [Bordetella genomosp. 5]